MTKLLQTVRGKICGKPKKHVVSPATFQQLIRTYGLRTTEIERLDEKVRNDAQLRTHATSG